MISVRNLVCVYIGLFLVYSLLRIHTLFSPILHDEGLFLAGAQACAMGEIPYRDFWDHKPPGVFWFHSTPLRLFPYSRFAVKVNEVAWIALSGTLFWLLCRRLFSRTTALATLSLYVFYTSAPITIRSGGLTEELALPWHVLAYLLVIAPKPRGRWPAFVAGVSLAIACQFRQTYILSAPAFVWVIWRESQNEGLNARTGLAHLGLFIAGLIVAEIFVSMYFLANGVWFEYIEASYWFNILYVRARSIPPTAQATFESAARFVLSTGPYLLSPLLACGSIGRLPVPQRRFMIPLVLLFVYDICGAEMSGERYEHYYVQAAVSSSLLIGLFLQSMVPSGANIKPWRRPDRIILFVLLLALCGTGIYRYASDFTRLIQKNGRAQHVISLQQAVAQAVQNITRPDDRILLLGKSPNSVYLLAHRLPGARYYHNSPLFKRKFRNVIPERFRQRFLQDLQTRRPVIVILGTAEGESITRGWDLVADRAPFMLHALKKNYVPLEQIVEELPPDWSWHGRFYSFLIRRDRVKEVTGLVTSLLPNTRS